MALKSQAADSLKVFQSIPVLPFQEVTFLPQDQWMRSIPIAVLQPTGLLALPGNVV